MISKIEINAKLREAQYFASSGYVDQAIETLADVIEKLLEEIEELRRGRA